MFILAYEFEAIVADFMVRLIITIASQPVLDLQFIIIIVIIIILTALDPGTFFFINLLPILCQNILVNWLIENSCD